MTFEGLVNATGIPCRVMSVIERFYLRKTSGLDLASLTIPGTDTPLKGRIACADYVHAFTDFLQKAGASLPAGWATQDTSSAGAPTLDFVSDVPNGQFKMQLDTTNEVECITLYSADHVWIPLSCRPIIEFRVQWHPDVSGASGHMAAGDKIVIGLASARTATLDNIARNAWFMLKAAYMKWYVETDDGTTDKDDLAAQYDGADVAIAADTWYTLKIDCSDLSNVKFYIDGADVTPATMDLSAAEAVSVQPFIEMQKAAASNQDHKLLVDYIEVSYLRYAA